MFFAQPLRQQGFSWCLLTYILSSVKVKTKMDGVFTNLPKCKATQDWALVHAAPDLKRTKLLRKFIGMEVGRSKYGIRGKKVTKPCPKCSCRDFRCSTLDFTTLSTSTPNDPGFWQTFLPSHNTLTSRSTHPFCLPVFS